MSCSKWQESIYLYDELTDKERRELEDHVQECTACIELLAEVRQTQELVARAATFQPVLRDSERLTQKIMVAVSPAPHHESWLVTMANHLFTRYALAACSFVLAGFFVYEQQSTSKRPGSVAAATSTTTTDVILDTSSFMKTVKQDRQGKGSAPKVSLYACAMTKGCDYAIVKYFKQKKHHENS